MIILDEKKYAEEILYDKDLGSKPYLSLSILARYYYNCLGFRKKKIVKALTEFMEKYYPRYLTSKQSWDEHIEKIAKSAGKYPLHEIEGINISESEMSVVRGIGNRVLERLAFTALCIAKFGNVKSPDNNSWVNIDDKELFSLANITCSRKERSKKLGELSVLGLVEFPKRNDNMHFRITFADDIEGASTAIYIDDFRELGYQYQQYCGETKYIKCIQCGKLITKSKNGVRRYCSDCAGYTSQRYKVIKCIDCGKDFEVSSLNNKSNRCDECYNIFRKKYIAQKASEYYHKKSE